MKINGTNRESAGGHLFPLGADAVHVLASVWIYKLYLTPEWMNGWKGVVGCIHLEGLGDMTGSYNSGQFQPT